MGAGQQPAAALSACAPRGPRRTCRPRSWVTVVDFSSFDEAGADFFRGMQTCLHPKTKTQSKGRGRLAGGEAPPYLGGHWHLE